VAQQLRKEGCHWWLRISSARAHRMRELEP
jgi:hypothetical protein